MKSPDICKFVKLLTRTLDNGTEEKSSQPLLITLRLRFWLYHPTTPTRSQDTLVWKENKAQQFSVKTAYKVALRLKNQSRVEHSAARAHGSVWNKMWTLNVPPKSSQVHVRACSNCLPIRDNLHRRRVQVEPICVLCNQEPETASHLLWTCPFARNVWALFNGRTQKCSNEVCDFFLCSTRRNRNWANRN